MKVKELIEFLNSIENKEQYIALANSDFSQSTDINYAIEVKTSSDVAMYPSAVCLIGDF